MKNLPNLITGVRLLAALIILCTCGSKIGHDYFLLLFIAAGISDMLDGYVARRFNWCTEFGATLDSISDLALYISVSFFLCISCTSVILENTPFILVGAAAQIFHLSMSYKKFGRFPAYHSTFSRCCAYAIFFCVIGFWLFKFSPILELITLLWAACSLEGFAISCILRESASNVPNIISAIARHRALWLATRIVPTPHFFGYDAQVSSCLNAENHERYYMNERSNL